VCTAIVSSFAFSVFLGLGDISYTLVLHRYGSFVFSEGRERKWRNETRLPDETMLMSSVSFLRVTNPTSTSNRLHCALKWPDVFEVISQPPSNQQFTQPTDK
jgi:hypothetical protein